MKRMQCSVTAWAAAVVLGSAGWVAAGPVVYDAQSRTISAELSEQFPTGGQDISARDEETASAPDFADWNASVEARIDNPPGNDIGLATISQQSRLADTGITSGGTGSVQTGTIDGSAGIGATLDVTFTLDERRDFALDYSFDPSEPDQGTANLTLSRVGGGTIFDIDAAFEFDRAIDDVIARGNSTGALEPGQYRFRFDYSTGGDIGADDLDYAVSLGLTPTDSGPAPNPIPLPPAAWAGLASMASVLLGGRVLRLRRRS